jgi:hypothetical protein
VPTGQFDKPSPSKLIKAMQALQQKAPVTAVNRLYVTGVQTYYGTWKSAEVADANLSVVQLQGGTICRFVAKGAHVTGLVAGDTVKLEKSPGFPLHITAKLVGNYLLALNAPTNVTPPSKPGSFAAPSSTSSTVTLTWTASTDNFGSGIIYNVYVNGKFRQSTALNALTATVTGLTAGTSYAFYVTATDGAGNASAPTSTINKSTTGTAPIPPGTSITKTYKATALYGYNYNGHNERDSWHNGNAYQGNPQDGQSYNQFGLIFFDSAQIRADLAGNTVTACSLSITYAHFYFNSGGKAIIGTHDYQSVPSTQSDAHADKDLFRINAKAGTRFTVNMGVAQGNNFKSGHAKGIQTGPQPSDIPGGTCYGYTYGLGSHVPVLTITYTTS